MMRAGIRYCQEMNKDLLGDTRFPYTEISCEDAMNGIGIEGDVSGIVLEACGLTTDRMEQAIKLVEQYQASYLLLDTRGDVSEERLYHIIGCSAQSIQNAKVQLFIENGYRWNPNGAICNYYFSEARNLKTFVQRVNENFQQSLCGVCMNVGYANLLGKNINEMIKDLGQEMRMVHVNENDGRSDQHQIPYTFTVGRGTWVINWYQIIGTLVRNRFDGWMVFDVAGAFKRMPGKLHVAVMDLLGSILAEWREQFQLEELLNQPGRKLILVGAGKMLENFVTEWGDKTSPAFVVDNNSALWGSRRFDLPIYPVEDILKLPPEERNVWICNLYYDEIGKQLKELGIAYRCYWDHYYLWV